MIINPWIQRVPLDCVQVAEVCQKTAWQLQEARRLQRGDEEGLRVFRRGWCVGSETFRKEQLGRMEGKLGEHHSGELRLETAKANVNPRMTR